MLTPEERRARRALRRERQRKDNVGRAAKMRAARRQMEAANSERSASTLTPSAFVGCSGWFYWKWRGLFYPEELPTNEWFKHYAKRFDTVEINASFYSWPTVANVKTWKHQAAKQNFVYTVKVCEHITHIKKFKGTKTLVKDFGMIADILDGHMGCFLFQLPPSYRYTKARLSAILGQLDPIRRNVVEFRHKSWWKEEVYAAFRKNGTIFAHAAPRDFRTNWFGQRTRSTCACTARSVGTGTIILRRSSFIGLKESGQAAQNEHGSISTTILEPTPHETRLPCGACWQAPGGRRVHRHRCLASDGCSDSAAPLLKAVRAGIAVAPDRL
jgi:uncharacterized protein YecE (DUF72 family)